MAASAGRTCSGSRVGCSSTRCSATPACTLISEMLWASTSCSSRAMRRRSSLARRRASSARAAWRSPARSSWTRISSAGRPSTRSHAASPPASAPVGPRPVVERGHHPGHQHVPADEHGHGQAPPPHHDGVHVGDDQAQEDRALRVVERQVGHDRGERHAERHLRPRAAPDERHRARPARGRAASGSRSRASGWPCEAPIVPTTSRIASASAGQSARRRSPAARPANRCGGAAGEVAVTATRTVRRPLRTVIVAGLRLLLPRAR